MMRILFLLPFLFLLSGCVLPGQSAYINDPLTGGVDSKTSALLHIPLPAGLQYYPSHSKLAGGARKEGLEVLRGHVDQAACGSTFYSRLKQAGWNLRMRSQAGSRAIYIYEKNDEIAALVFQAQGMLTIVQIWLGVRLTDNATPDFSLAPEDTGGMAAPGPSSGTNGPAEEKWGLEEREL